MRRASRRVHRPLHSSLSELNITPLLDLVFVLLVIFIISTPQLINNLEFSLPSGKTRAFPEAKPKVNQIVVTETGALRLNDQEVTLPQLKETLAEMRAANPKTSVILRG